MNAIKDVLKELLTSKKALALLAAAIVWGLAQAGIVATPTDILPLLGVISAYLVGQGIADKGKEAVKELAKAQAGKPSGSEAPE